MKPQMLLAATLLGALSCNSDVTGLGPPSDPATETFAASLGVNIAAMTKAASGVYYLDVVLGTGPSDTATTDSVFVNYQGHLKDGTLFDSGSNVKFIVGDLVVGVRTGLLGAKEGGKRKIVVPSELGYGGRALKNADGTIQIPRQSTLVFDIELLKVHNRPDTTTTATLRAPAAVRRGG